METACPPPYQGGHHRNSDPEPAGITLKRWAIGYDHHNIQIRIQFLIFAHSVLTMGAELLGTKAMNQRKINEHGTILAESGWTQKPFGRWTQSLAVFLVV